MAEANGPEPTVRNQQDARDRFVMGAVTAAWIASTVYLFIHPSEGAFATWAGLAVTMVGAYHWLVILDDKRPDAGGQNASTS